LCNGLDEDQRSQLMKSQRLFKTLCASVVLDDAPIVLLFNKVPFITQTEFFFFHPFVEAHL
jgi:hypothetical protein